MENIAIIFAGGIGRRMNSRALPKQFLKLYGKEIIIYTLEQFENSQDINKIVVACVEEWIEHLGKLVEKYGLKKVVKIVPGGKTGQDSIYSALRAAEEISEGDSTVLIHDGVRPLINKELIKACIKTVKEKGNAITVSRAIETIINYEESGKITGIVDRNKCMLARAPQCFRLNDILSAHRKAIEEKRHDFIDSASLMKHYGMTLYVVEGPVENIKITTPMDYYTFKALFEAKENSQLFGYSNQE